jgi:hypothetical protein
MTSCFDAPASTCGEGAGGNREVPALCLPAGMPGGLQGRRGGTGETWFPLWEAVDGRMPPAADGVLVGASRRAA